MIQELSTLENELNRSADERLQLLRDKNIKAIENDTPLQEALVYYKHNHKDIYETIIAIFSNNLLTDKEIVSIKTKNPNLSIDINSDPEYLKSVLTTLSIPVSSFFKAE